MNKILFKKYFWPLFPRVIAALCMKDLIVQNTSKHCIKIFIQRSKYRAVNLCCLKLIKLTENMDHESMRKGAIDCLATILNTPSIKDIIAPYLVFIIQPLMTRMADPNNDIRKIACEGFSNAVKLIPLERSKSSPSEMHLNFTQKRPQKRHFLDQILDGTTIETLQIPIKIKTMIRPYQQDGVNWLWFLHKLETIFKKKTTYF